MESKLNIYVTRGDLARRFDPSYSSHSIDTCVDRWMQEVSGARKMDSHRGSGIGDEYHATYHIAPEGVTVRFEILINPKVYAAGEPDKISEVGRRMREALEKKSE